MKKYFKSTQVLLLAVLVCTTFTGWNVAVAAEQNTLIIFDASGSMLEDFGGVKRIDAAKKAVNDFLGNVSPTVNIALRGYAHIAHPNSMALACKETALLQGFTTNHSLIQASVNNLSAVGTYTPTAYALMQAAKDFQTGNDNSIILLTDGLETCGGDPVSAAKVLCSSGINVKSYVVGLGLDSQAKTQLQAVADAGCGKYFDATDASSLASSLASIKSEVGIDKTRNDSVPEYQRVRGGNGFDSAVTIQPGAYQLDHHQRDGEFDYFKLNLEKGRQYKLTISNNEGIRVKYDTKTDTFTEEERTTTSYSYTGMDVHLPNRAKALHISISGYYGEKLMLVEPYFYTYDGLWYLISGFPKVVSSSHVGKPGVESEIEHMYLLFGNGITNQHKDASFKIEVIEDKPASSIVATSSATSDKVGDSAVNVATGGTTNEEDRSDDDDGKVIAEEKDKNFLLYGIIGALVLVVIGLLIYVLTRNKGGTPPPAPPPTLPPTDQTPPQGL